MKIIATVSSDRFLVEATKEEIAKVMGHSCTYAMKDADRTIRVGADVQVSPLWSALEVTRGRQSEVANLATQMRKLADRVDSVNKALAAPIIEVKGE